MGVRMLGKRSAQRGLFEADTQFRDFVGGNSFYAFLANHCGELFRDESFAGLYAPKRGRPSVPPSLLATALVLQTTYESFRLRDSPGSQGGLGLAEMRCEPSDRGTVHLLLD
jgi:hypothetical protein